MIGAIITTYMILVVPGHQPRILLEQKVNTLQECFALLLSETESIANILPSGLSLEAGCAVSRPPSQAVEQ